MYYVYLYLNKLEPSIDMQIFIKLDFLDVFMFFMIFLNMVTLNFVFDSGCGEFSSRIINVLIGFWIIISVSATFGYFIYKKIFLRIE